MTMTTSDEVLSIYARCGSAAYFGEAVSMTEHALQAAYFARAADASDALVIAALLHDIGHLIEAVPDDIADWHSDARHELSGSRWLSRRFGPEVCEPVRLHVPAKRFLCASGSRPSRTIAQRLRSGSGTTRARSRACRHQI
jgi:predicted HD phosphohydrolase